MHYWAAPKPKVPGPDSLDDIDPEIRAAFDKLGISLAEQERLAGVTNVAVDAIIDSVSVATTFKATLAEAGVKNDSAQVEHESSTSKIDDDQLFYCRQRGLDEEDATSMIVNGFCREVFDELPMEYAVEAQALMRLTLEGAVG